MWFHKLLNPHCIHCIEQARELKICNSCEILKHEIELLRANNERLLNELLHKPSEEMPKAPETITPRMPTHIPWNVRKQMLENEDREKAKLMKQQPVATNNISELEKELGVEDNAS